MIKIVLDAMGGDNAPKAIIEGAYLALEEMDDIQITLIGNEEAIMPFYHEHPRLSLKFTTEVIEMAESPVRAIQKKKDSSIVVGMNMVKNKEADAFVTAGSTGAAIAGGTLLIRRIKGIQRPALAPMLPTRTGGQLLLIDCGANIDCKSSFLKQFGIMGSIYMERVMGIKNPRVCLINNGAEEEKGNALTKEAYQLLKNTDCINFAGNAEGRDVLSGDFDVAVCDGFVGNVFMKSIEGFAAMLMGMLKDSLMSSWKSKIGAFLSKKAFAALKKKMDYTEYGGSPLLGVNGCVIKSHGSSDAKTIKNSVRQAKLFIERDVVRVISEGIAAQIDPEEEE